MEPRSYLLMRAQFFFTTLITLAYRLLRLRTEPTVQNQLIIHLCFQGGCPTLISDAPPFFLVCYLSCLTEHLLSREFVASRLEWRIESLGSAAVRSAMRIELFSVEHEL